MYTVKKRQTYLGNEKNIPKNLTKKFRNFFEILILKSFESRYYETDYADYAGVFFIGTATPRKYWRPENVDLATPRMAVIGELDGISRVTRFINYF